MTGQRVLAPAGVSELASPSQEEWTTHVLPVKRLGVGKPAVLTLVAGPPRCEVTFTRGFVFLGSRTSEGVEES